MNMKKVGKTMKRFWPLYLMFVPGVIYLFINCYIPHVRYPNRFPAV